MAMRLLTEAEFESELSEMGLVPTGKITKLSKIWIDANREPITIPYGLTAYPDYILDEIYSRIKKLDTDKMHLGELDYSVRANRAATA